MVEPFDRRPGIHQVISGYTGGHVENPTYEEVCTNTTGHVEAVQITFNPNIFPYEQLLNIFWQQIDPTDDGGQFHDRGESYKTAIFYHNNEQKYLAKQSKQQLNESGKFSKPIVTEILEAQPFYEAEEAHQHYYKKNRFHYDLYRKGSGRAQFIENHWQQSYDKDELKKKLTEMQYHVTQEDGTEPPFNNEYNDFNEEGIYVDVVSGEVLFSSLDKYDAHCGWPSFTKPVIKNNVDEHIDTTHGMIRTEVRSKHDNSNLSNVFNYRPKETCGLKYCINSAALKIIKKEDMEKEGYERFLYLFNSER